MTKPSEYSRELADNILQRIMDGEMLSVICKDDGMPSRLAFYKWMNGRDELKNDYARARLAWADYWAERIMLISVNPDGAVEADGKVFLDNAAIMWAKHLTDNAKWLVGKYAPRTYGDKPEAEQSNNLVSLQKIERVIIGPKESPEAPRAQLTYDPGPLPARIDPEILVRLVNLIKERVPKADQRSPDAVLDEVMGVIDRALIAEYGPQKAEAQI